MLTRRKWHGAVNFENIIFTFGGTGVAGLLGSAEGYDVVHNEWNPVKPM